MPLPLKADRGEFQIGGKVLLRSMFAFDVLVFGVFPVGEVEGPVRGKFRQRNANSVFSPVSTAKLPLCARRNVPGSLLFAYTYTTTGTALSFQPFRNSNFKIFSGEHAPGPPWLENAQSRSAQAPSLKNVLRSSWRIRLIRLKSGKVFFRTRSA